jgi:hypothetical protein
MSYAHKLGDLRQYYGKRLDTRSHGESFMTLFQSQFVPNGLYLLDEPEASLSTHPTVRAHHCDQGYGHAEWPIHHRHPLAYPDGFPGGIHPGL